jgi:RND family efflux transporter MFP subunit
VSAQVKTEPLQQHVLSDALAAFGEVTTGPLVAISFPRGGQVSRLLVVVNQRVKSGTRLATLTSDPNARLAYAQASSALNFSQGELRRIQELFSLQLATQSQVDGARKALEDAQANLAVQQQLGGDVGSATVAAPFNGVVAAVTVAEGDRLQPGAAILQLGPTDVLRVQLGIEPGDAHLVRPGMPVTLSPVSDLTQTVSASIQENQGVVNAKTQLVDAITIVSAARAAFLVPGMHVRATVKIGQHLGWAVPRAAILTDAAGTYLFQVLGGKARRVNVTSGEESQGLVAISGAVDPHLPIVVLGNYELQDGMQVREGP